MAGGAGREVSSPQAHPAPGALVEGANTEAQRQRGMQGLPPHARCQARIPGGPSPHPSSTQAQEPQVHLQADQEWEDMLLQIWARRDSNLGTKRGVWPVGADCGGIPEEGRRSAGKGEGLSWLKQ